ncbi:hypothetical protein [Vannielia litorea]|uniref:Phage DNA packaging protein, Nu1 subunit of terminase n=1 Tax=Vannielia litorea TaxID=1217970 RepID=A0A1N6FUY5_9RHOB|nr:hypothetical protein [Vannielia litorea]SIN99068.1 Phage DNA packaging protein, Nu1 subunit of terminase [Vannielia litorea]
MEAEIEDLLDMSPDAEPPSDGELVTSAELAEWLGLSTGRLNQLARDGVLPRETTGLKGHKFPLRASVRAYCEHTRAAARSRTADPELADHKKRLAAEQADKIALQNARARGDLLDATAVRAEWLSVAADLRARLLAVPARVAATVGLNRPAAAALDIELRRAMSDLAETEAND